MAPEGADHYTCPLGHTRTPFSSAACPYPAYILPSSSSSSSWELFVTLRDRTKAPSPHLSLAEPTQSPLPPSGLPSPARQATWRSPNPHLQGTPVKNTPGSE